MDGRRDGVMLADRSSSSVAALLEAGVDGVILPFGATEQHGPHLPLDTDTRLATELARRIARRLDDTLVAPAVPLGPSAEHGSFPGTLSLRPGTLERVVGDVVESLDRQGFERVVLLPGHGGSFPAIDAVYPELTRRTNADVVAVTGLGRFLDRLQEGLREAGVEVDEPAGHAGAAETAMLLAVAPELVGERPRGHTGPVSAAALFSRGVETYDENGVLGDARPATAEVGEALLEHLAQAYAAYVREEFRALDDRP
ncbi:MAG: creatininase family protein [Halobacteriales archaeon]